MTAIVWVALGATIAIIVVWLWDALRYHDITPPGQSGEEDWVTVTIAMPRWMHDDLRQRSRQDGISVTELMRRQMRPASHGKETHDE